jgi:hypothetical protein
LIVASTDGTNFNRYAYQGRNNFPTGGFMTYVRPCFENPIFFMQEFMQPVEDNWYIDCTRQTMDCGLADLKDLDDSTAEYAEVMLLEKPDGLTTGTVYNLKGQLTTGAYTPAHIAPMFKNVTADGTAFYGISVNMTGAEVEFILQTNCHPSADIADAFIVEMVDITGVVSTTTMPLLAAGGGATQMVLTPPTNLDCTGDRMIGFRLSMGSGAFPNASVIITSWSVQINFTTQQNQLWWMPTPITDYATAASIFNKFRVNACAF